MLILQKFYKKLIYKAKRNITSSEDKVLGSQSKNKGNQIEKMSSRKVRNSKR